MTTNGAHAGNPISSLRRGPAWWRYAAVAAGTAATLGLAACSSTPESQAQLLAATVSASHAQDAVVRPTGGPGRATATAGRDTTGSQNAAAPSPVSPSPSPHSAAKTAGKQQTATGSGAEVEFTFAGPDSANGATQQYTVPNGVTTVAIAASGASGGKPRQAMGAPASYGAEVKGNLAVQPGQLLTISVAGAGADASDHDSDPLGGWGGMGAKGGNGNAASDTLRTSGAGGGATTVQISNVDGSDLQTVLIAGGGGGEGARSGDLVPAPWGGSAGCVDGQPSWTGANGGNGTTGPTGGRGGAAAAEPTMVGGRSEGGSGLGGNGAGGGGGVNGGAPGTSASGTSAAGGGGAGSSMVSNLLTATSVFCSTTAGNGVVTITPSS